MKKKETSAKELANNILGPDNNKQATDLANNILGPEYAGNSEGEAIAEGYLGKEGSYRKKARKKEQVAYA
jgi:hypothetical protein